MTTRVNYTVDMMKLHMYLGNELQYLTPEKVNIIHMHACVLMLHFELYHTQEIK